MRANQDHQWSCATVQEIQQHWGLLCKEGKACSPAQAFRTGFQAFDHARHCDSSSGCPMPATATSAGGFLSTLGFKMLKLSMTAQQIGAVNWTLLAVTFSKVIARKTAVACRYHYATMVW